MSGWPQSASLSTRPASEILNKQMVLLVQLHEPSDFTFNTRFSVAEETNTSAPLPRSKIVSPLLFHVTA
jgi:hypothetical protein